MKAVTKDGTESMQARLLLRTDAHLDHLYAISKLLTRFQGIDQTLIDIMAIVTGTLGLRSAIFILELPGPQRTILWQSKGETPTRLLMAKAHAQRAYGYLVLSGVDFEVDAVAVLDLPRRPPTEEAGITESEKHFVILPLVDGAGAIFGALQLEGGQSWKEHHLVFVDAVVNQLAIAVDRQILISSRQAACEAAEREQRQLAELSALVGASLDIEEILRAVVRFAVPSLADLCLIDQIAEDGRAHRPEVKFADDEKKGHLAAQIRLSVAQPGGDTAQAKVMAARTSLCLNHPAPRDLEGICPQAGSGEVLCDLGIDAMLIVPMLARGRILGVVTFCAIESGRRYSAADVCRAEELIRRAAMAIDNARLFEQAQRATRARDNLLSVVSHDLKNYVTACLFSASSLMEESKKTASVKTQKQVQIVQRSAIKINRLLNDLLQTASMEAGAFTVEKQRLDLRPLVAEELQALQPLATGKKQALTSDLPADLPLVSADEGRIQQVLANLIGNAIKFTPNGRQISVGAVANNGEVTISVTDTGPGIAEDELPQLFRRFWQTKRTARQGTGLGLFIVKGIVEAHGGRVWADSKLGTGSTFSFTLSVA